MARTTQPEFGTRHNKPKPPSPAGATPEDTWRIDWKLVALIVVVFVAAYVWLF